MKLHKIGKEHREEEFTRLFPHEEHVKIKSANAEWYHISKEGQRMQVQYKDYVGEISPKRSALERIVEDSGQVRPPFSAPLVY